MSPPRQLKLLSPGKSPAKRRRLASSSPSAKDRWSTNKRPFPFLDFPVEIQTMALTELLTEMPPQLVVRSASKPHPPPVLRVSKGICEQALQVLRNIYFYQKSISSADGVRNKDMSLRGVYDGVPSEEGEGPGHIGVLLEQGTTRFRYLPRFSPAEFAYTRSICLLLETDALPAFQGGGWIFKTEFEGMCDTHEDDETQFIIGSVWRAGADVTACCAAESREQVEQLRWEAVKRAKEDFAEYLDVKDEYGDDGKFLVVRVLLWLPKGSVTSLALEGRLTHVPWDVDVKARRES